MNMTPTNPLADLRRLDAAAMGPCVMCDRQLLETGLPLFYRIEAKRCGIDAKAVQSHVGLALMMGGGRAGLVLADVMGPGVKPIVVMAEPPSCNVCTECAQKWPLEMIVLRAAEKHEEEKEKHDDEGH